PGMMDTVLNLGINDDVVAGLAKLTGNERFAYDSYRRFIQMYADVVEELGKDNFEAILSAKKQEKGVKADTDLTADDLKDVVKRYKVEYKKLKGENFPTDPKVQLIAAVKAVFRSWNNPRAIYYRKMNDIPGDIGTAVNVQMMVFGNMGNDSGTGVAFSRNPATGEDHIYGEFLMNAQGEDVVAGVRTPLGIDDMKRINAKVYDQFCKTAKKLEKYYKNMQDMEFTIEKGKLYMLQTRNGKRSAQAALKIACDLFDEGLVTKQEAVLLVEPQHLDALLHPNLDAKALKTSKPIAQALPASPGGACGQIVFNAADAATWAANGKKVILIRVETSPEDIEGMYKAQGILTARGGMTSHAAVVARGIGTCCVAGCSSLIVDEKKKTIELNGNKFKEGDYISLDGSTGCIYKGQIPTVQAKISGNFSRLMKWADEFRVLHVRTNADTPKDAKQAVEFGAEGIGLTRTEHMFFEESRIKAVREMIVAKTTEQRKLALVKLLPMQRGDFEGIYEEMKGLPVTIRYLDPPLHEFLPKEEKDIIAIAKDLNMTPKELHDVVDSLHEFNPMMGHRGCRLAVTYPEIAEMQTQAVIEAALAENKKHPKWHIEPEIMIPLVGDLKEFQFVRDIVDRTAQKIIKEKKAKLKYHVGTMIEIPRAALLADEIAQDAEFFSFGTNDLTQMTFGFSRDDAAKFLESYYANKIYQNDPFAKLDQHGVGKLIEMAVKGGRATRPNLKCGICGEHGGDASSIEFCHRTGLDYVSCSPFRVPLARLAAAQAAIKYPKLQPAKKVAPKKKAAPKKAVAKKK
ncbi:MAG: pyruvate, phosphate dikinase, partial [Bacilli bacterium]|nr:pyruvate, phosphate dikinase [Bacilli bacterium]